MLNDKYQRINMYNFWKNLNTTTIFSGNDAWGNINANDATIYMEELYNYYITKNKYSDELLNYFIKAYNIITVPEDNILIANKSSWSDNALHDVALIFDDNPYILVILTNHGYTEYESFFKEVSNLIYTFHTEYCNQKKIKCLN